MDLKIQDLLAAIKIIDVASARGAFRGEELSTVGGVRDKFVAFTNAAQPTEEELESQEDPVEEDDEAYLGE